ncbi:hypothetical protein DFS34DRAFT_589350 [Phlyctochytrium arcticum]|nr:hypothetical protein DFS34DRAFT_589350 [Phlyctochytrium arcticum]
MSDHAPHPHRASFSTARFGGSHDSNLNQGHSSSLHHTPRSSNSTLHSLSQTPNIWFSAPDLRLARAAEVESVEPESQAQQRARAKFFDEQTSTDVRRWWYPLVLAEDLETKKVLGTSLLGDHLVLWRDAEGTPVCLEDKCAHRSAPLSLGRITEDGELECAYDGWRYDSEGAVTHIPALLPDREIPTNACARRYPTVERDGLIWVWPGDPTLPAYDIHARLPPILSPGANSSHSSTHPIKQATVARSSDESDDDTDTEGVNEATMLNSVAGQYLGDSEREKWGKVFTGVVDVDIDQTVLLECFLDYAHVPYTQQSTLPMQPPAVKPTPVQVDISFGTETPSVIAKVNRFEAGEGPIEVKFIPPCHVQISHSYEGKQFQQTFHCVPLRQGYTRIIYRHARNYWAWLDWIPFVGGLYHAAWLRKVGGDYAVLKGIQDRLRDGAKPWNAPIQSDLLPRYYREWFKRCMQKPNAFFSTYGPPSTTSLFPQSQAHHGHHPSPLHPSHPLHPNNQPSPTIANATVPGIVPPPTSILSAFHAPAINNSSLNPYGPASSYATSLYPSLSQYATMHPSTIRASQPRSTHAYSLAHIQHPAPSQLGIIQAASAAAATAAVTATGGTSRRGSIANLVGVGGVGGGHDGARRGSMM